MTHHTDAEQLHQLLELVLTELDRKAIPIAYMQEIDRKGKAFIEQAARRAPVVKVPQGCKPVPVELLERIQESLGLFVSDQGWSQSDMDTADALDGLLAAAPQPPACNPSMQPELATYSAPVQLPEYGIDTANHAGIRVRGYTEQQVRELLANHGIQEKQG